nr:polysaccharide pyruvyl transferase family protein [uncultured Agrobacterium sp.]
MENQKIAFVGAFGVGNRGDDYLALAFSETYRPVVQIGFAPMEFLATAEFLPFEKAAEQDYTGFKVIICGGSFIWSVEQLDCLINLAACVKKTSGTIEARCVHVESNVVLANSGKFIELAKQLDLITVRDSLSRKLCQEFGIFADIEKDKLASYILGKYAKNTPSPNAYRIGFNFHNFGENSLDWYYEFLATLNHLAPAELTLNYIVQCRHLSHPASNEAMIAEFLFSKFGGKINIIDGGPSLDSLIDGYRTNDVVITNRTHGILIADALGITTITAGVNDEKALGIARDLGTPVYHMKEPPRAAAARLAKTIWPLSSIS